MKSRVRPRWLAAAVCGVALLALFQFYGNPVRGYINTASLFYWWGFQWVNPASEGEHGWLILGLSAWLLWKNLEKSEVGSPKSEVADPNSAFAAMAGGLALHAVGFVAQQTRISIVAFLLCTWGVLRLGGGRRWGAAALFPLGFMLFAIPVNLLDSVGFWLRVWVVNASAALAHAAGIGVLQSGTQLTAPDGAYNYDVAAACSGLRSLTAMVALALLAGYLNFHAWWRRALVVLLCLPLVYAGNVARIMAIIFAAQVGGPRWGSVAHDVMGYGIFVIVLGGVLAGVSALRRWWPEPAPAPPAAPAQCHLLDDTVPLAGSPSAHPVGGDCHLIDDTLPGGALSRAERAGGGRGQPGADRPAWAVAGLVVACAVAEMFFLRQLAQRPARGEAGVLLAADGVNPVELPAFLGTDWIGQRAPISPVEREVLPPDTGFSRRNYAFLADRRCDVFLSVVLSGRDRSSIHRPELCLVGQGWTITGATLHRFQFADRRAGAFDATLLRVNREVQVPAAPGRPRGKEIVPQLVAYWFIGGDRVLPSHWQRVACDAWNRVAHGRADRWAYVLMQTDARDGEPAALARMQAVLDATLPAFQRPVSAP